MNEKQHIQNAQMLIDRAVGDYGNQLMALVGIADALIAIAMVLEQINERGKKAEMEREADIELEELRKRKTDELRAVGGPLPPFSPMTLTDIGQ